MKIEIPYVPTPIEVVDEMLRLANIRRGEVVVDPGCGDCRILIRCVENYDAYGIGIERSRGLVEKCVKEVQKRGLHNRILIVYGDLLEFKYTIADVVTLYLGTDINERLRPKLERELRPGTRVVSHDFEVPGWKPVKIVKVQSWKKVHTLYLYRQGISW